MSDNKTIDNFYLNYSYEINNCSNYSGSGNITIGSISREWFILGLEEDSQISISLVAVNMAGRSALAKLQTATLTACEL